MSRASSQWRTTAASCVIGILVGASAVNWTVVAQVAENRTLLNALRRDVDFQREDFKAEQKRTDDRMNRHQEVVRDFMSLLDKQMALMKQMMETKNKP